MMVSGPVFPAITLGMNSDILKAPCIGIWGLNYMGSEADGILCVCVYIKYDMDIPNTHSIIQNAPRLKIL